VVQTTPANHPDQHQLPALLAAVPPLSGPRGGRPRRKPLGVYGDRAYGSKERIAHLRALSIASHLAPRAPGGEQPIHGSGLGRIRYVVERTLACFSHFRRLRMCYERWGKHFQAFHDLTAASLITTRLRNQMTF
jgi:hypothetical protein